MKSKLLNIKLLNAVVISSLFISGYAAAEQTTTDNVNQVVEKSEQIASKSSDKLNEATKTVTENADKYIDETKVTATDKVNQAVEKAEKIASEAGDKLSEATKAITEQVDKYIDDTSNKVKATATDKANQVAEKAEQIASEAGEKLSETTTTVMGKVDKYIDDATITAKVKRAIADDNLDAGYTISVVTNGGIVTLSGFVPNVEWQLKAVKLASAVEGVQSVSDKLHIKEDKPTTLKAYSSDAKITSEVKAKLLIADNVPLTGIKVETVSGIVQLSGFVKATDQIANAERVAKTVEGVQTVKNDLVVQP